MLVLLSTESQRIFLISYLVQIWPPKSIKDSGSSLHSKLKETIMQTGLEKNLFGSHPVSLPAAEYHGPPAFASDPLVHLSANGGREKSSSDPSTATGIGPPEISVTDIVEIDGPNARGN
ncbi:hypothetical protein IFM89_016712 [Coptis chinensis]|uniref:ZFPL1-like U-box domain-containing protein n=1 Tax=Coptis chinensis TaxID=261450 RepID=A0A835M690_9MAGN|nr:hypothetical protein IFM89_016712 [Coptis chinensis]